MGATHSPGPGKMIGLFLSEVVLFVVAGLGGFAVGWRLQSGDAEDKLRRIRDDIDNLNTALTDAQVRRAARFP